MRITDLFLADLRGDLAGGGIPIEVLVERWAQGRPGPRRQIRAALRECEHLGHIVIENGIVRLAEALA